MDISTSDLQRVIEEFADGLGDELVKHLTYAGNRAGTYVEGLIREYPPRVSKPLPLYYTRQGRNGAFKSKFKTAKQQRYFFYALAQGIIKVPRTRTGQLGRSFTHEVETSASTVTIFVGTNLDYARYVVGSEDEQSHYHRENGWRSLPEVIQENQAAIGQVFFDAFIESMENGIQP